jgi:diaminopimelate epimerase
VGLAVVFLLRPELYSPDGSEAEKSGNGLRMFSHDPWDRTLVGDEESAIQTPGGLVRARVLDGGSAGPEGTAC